MKGFTVWITGLPSSGKSTLARMLEKVLNDMDFHVEVLDGDEVRLRLSKGLGFSKEDRDENIRRISYVAKIVTRCGAVAITCAISPYREIRDEARREIGRFVEVYVKCTLEECISRDVKGMYKKALSGEIKNFTGISDPYEEPLNPEIIGLKGERKSCVMKPFGFPPKQGLYDPQYEHDSCGIGFVVNTKGKKSNDIVRHALTVLKNLYHRGACGCEANTGDGAGILMQIPHAFFRKVCSEIGIYLPSSGEYGIGIVFLPPDPYDRRECEKRLEDIIIEEGQYLLGWRTVPTNNASIGNTARLCEPCVRQVFIGRNSKIQDDMAFERKLYVIRKRAERDIRYSGMKGGEYFYMPSSSYKI